MKTVREELQALANHAEYLRMKVTELLARPEFVGKRVDDPVPAPPTPPEAPATNCDPQRPDEGCESCQ